MAARRLNGDEEAILDAMCERRTITTGDIASQTGLSMATVEQRLRFLSSRRYCEAAGYDPSVRTGVGRPQTIWGITERGRQAAITPNPDVWQAG